MTALPWDNPHVVFVPIIQTARQVRFIIDYRISRCYSRWSCYLSLVSKSLLERLCHSIDDKTSGKLAEHLGKRVKLFFLNVDSQFCFDGGLKQQMINFTWCETFQ